MFCPECGEEGSKVIDSRNAENSNYPLVGEYDAVYRRRECKHCGHRWTTYELKAEQLDLE